MSNKKVSIITTNFNCVSKNAKSYFYEMFRSIHEQDYPYIEHVIIDGGSKDGSVEFINDLIKKYGKKEIVFISEPDKGINDATNKGYRAATGDYITLMCNDDFYTKPDAISILVKTLENNYADFSYADTWWLDNKCWGNDSKSFVYRHPFLINALLLKRKLISESPYYLDEKYPMLADFDLFIRLLTRENIKESSTEEVLTVLRPGGFSQSNPQTYIKDVLNIYKKFFPSFIFTRRELKKMHSGRIRFITFIKSLLFIHKKKIKESIKYYFKKKKYKKGKKKYYSRSKSREWIETFYNEFFKI